MGKQKKKKMTNNLTGSRLLSAATPAEMNPRMIIHVVIDEIIETIEDNNSTIEQDETNTRDRDARDQQQQQELTLEAKLRSSKIVKVGINYSWLKTVQHSCQYYQF